MNNLFIFTEQENLENDLQEEEKKIKQEKDILEQPINSTQTENTLEENTLEENNIQEEKKDNSNYHYKIIIGVVLIIIISISAYFIYKGNKNGNNKNGNDKNGNDKVKEGLITKIKDLSKQINEATPKNLDKLSIENLNIEYRKLFEKKVDFLIRKIILSEDFMNMVWETLFFQGQELDDGDYRKYFIIRGICLSHIVFIINDDNLFAIKHDDFDTKRKKFSEEIKSISNTFEKKFQEISKNILNSEPEDIKKAIEDKIKTFMDYQKLDNIKRFLENILTSGHKLYKSGKSIDDSIQEGYCNFMRNIYKTANNQQRIPDDVNDRFLEIAKKICTDKSEEMNKIMNYVKLITDKQFFFSKEFCEKTVALILNYRYKGQNNDNDKIKPYSFLGLFSKNYFLEKQEEDILIKFLEKYKENIRKLIDEKISSIEVKQEIQKRLNNLTDKEIETNINNYISDIQEASSLWRFKFEIENFIYSFISHFLEENIPLKIDDFLNPYHEITNQIKINIAEKLKENGSKIINNMYDFFTNYYVEFKKNHTGKAHGQYFKEYDKIPKGDKSFQE